MLINIFDTFHIKSITRNIKIAHCVGIPFHSIPFHISSVKRVLKIVVASLLGWWCDQRKKKHRMCIFSWPVLFVHNDLFETTQKYHKTICIIFILVVFIYLFFFIFWMIWFLSPLTRSRSFISFFVLFFLSQNESNRCDQQARLYWIKLLKRMLLLSNKYHALFFYDSNIFFYMSYEFLSFDLIALSFCACVYLSHSLLFSSIFSASFQLLFTPNIL